MNIWDASYFGCKKVQKWVIKRMDVWLDIGNCQGPSL